MREVATTLQWHQSRTKQVTPGVGAQQRSSQHLCPHAGWPKAALATGTKFRDQTSQDGFAALVALPTSKHLPVHGPLRRNQGKSK